MPMSREDQLKNQLEELRKAKTYFADKIGNCMQLTDSQKAKMHNELAPFIMRYVEKKLNTGVASDDWQNLRDVLAEKAMKVILGDDYKERLEKI